MVGNSLCKQKRFGVPNLRGFSGAKDSARRIFFLEDTLSYCGLVICTLFNISKDYINSVFALKPLIIVLVANAITVQVYNLESDTAYTSLIYITYR